MVLSLHPCLVLFCMYLCLAEWFTWMYRYNCICYKIISVCDILYIQITKEAVLNNDELLQQFTMFVNFKAKQMVDSEMARALYKELMSRVIHTMANSFYQCLANSFYQCQEVLKIIVENKGVDAQVALRDKLKVYASESRSKLAL